MTHYRKVYISEEGNPKESGKYDTDLGVLEFKNSLNKFVYPDFNRFEHPLWYYLPIPIKERTCFICKIRQFFENIKKIANECQTISEIKDKIAIEYNRESIERWEDVLIVFECGNLKLEEVIKLENKAMEKYADVKLSSKNEQIENEAVKFSEWIQSQHIDLVDVDYYYKIYKQQTK